MTCLCSGESLVRAWRRISFRAFFLKRCFRIIRRVGDGGLDVLVELRIGAATARCKCLVAGYRHKPGRDGRAPFEPACLTPHVQKNFGLRQAVRRSRSE